MPDTNSLIEFEVWTFEGSTSSHTSTAVVESQERQWHVNASMAVARCCHGVPALPGHTWTFRSWQGTGNHTTFAQSVLLYLIWSECWENPYCNLTLILSYSLKKALLFAVMWNKTLFPYSILLTWAKTQNFSHEKLAGFVSNWKRIVSEMSWMRNYWTYI